jgi:intracellular septation protein
MAATETKPDAEVSWTELRPQLIRLALELGPLIVFFAVNTLGERWLESNAQLQQWFSSPIILATAVFMVAMAISLLLSWILLHRVAVMPLVTGIVVLVFGDVYKLKDKGWWILTWRWGAFFFLLAALNELVWRGAPLLTGGDVQAADDLWVAFKVWGIMPLTIVFSLFQLPLLRDYAPEPPTPVPPTVEG